MIAFNTLGAESDYLKWIAEHPAGFVVNCYRPNPTPSYMVLHLATCWTIGPKNSGGGRLTGAPVPEILLRTASGCGPVGEWIWRRGAAMRNLQADLGSGIRQEKQ